MIDLRLGLVLVAATAVVACDDADPSSGADASAVTDGGGTPDATSSDSSAQPDTGAGSDAMPSSDGAAGGYAGSCDHNNFECLNYINEYDTPTSVEEDCTRQAFTYLADECPTDDLIATCDQTPYKIFHYYTGYETLPGAETTCGLIGGTWTAL